MKTEKEQIEEMRREIENGFRKADCRAPYTNAPYPYFETQKIAIAEALYDAGYGDISEYKAEIKRLKSNTPQHLKDLLIEFDEMGFVPTTVCPNPDKYATEWRDRLVNCVNNATKQAKIDVLNEVRERLTEGRVANDNVVINANYEIGKLIKEVQNGEDKG